MEPVGYLQRLHGAPKSALLMAFAENGHTADEAGTLERLGTAVVSLKRGAVIRKAAHGVSSFW